MKLAAERMPEVEERFLWLRNCVFQADDVLWLLIKPRPPTLMHPQRLPTFTGDHSVRQRGNPDTPVVQMRRRIVDGRPHTRQRLGVIVVALSRLADSRRRWHTCMHGRSLEVGPYHSHILSLSFQELGSNILHICFPLPGANLSQLHLRAAHLPTCLRTGGGGERLALSKLSDRIGVHGLRAMSGCIRMAQ